MNSMGHPFQSNLQIPILLQEGFDHNMQLTYCLNNLIEDKLPQFQ